MSLNGRRPRRAWRRHHAAAQLADCPLPHKRIFLGTADIERVELELRRLQTLIVAGDAIAVDERLIGTSSLRCSRGERKGEDGEALPPGLAHRLVLLRLVEVGKEVERPGDEHGAEFAGRGRRFDDQLKALHAAWKGETLPGGDMPVAPTATNWVQSSDGFP